jgi:hypothetical protein
VAAIEPATPADDATVSLMRQLQHLRASEQAQREYAAQRVAAPTLPAGRADPITLWKQAGNLSDEDAAFLEARPSMIDNPQVTRAAYAATLQAGIERNSPDFAAAMEGNFASLLNRAHAQAQPAATDPAGFFQAPEPPRPPAAPDRAACTQRRFLAAQSAAIGSRRLLRSAYRLRNWRSRRPPESPSASMLRELRLLKAKASGELQ